MGVGMRKLPFVYLILKAIEDAPGFLRDRSFCGIGWSGKTGRELTTWGMGNYRQYMPLHCHKPGSK